MSCYVCDEDFRYDSNDEPIYGLLYGQKVCPECYRRGEKSLLWSETLGTVAKEHTCCYSPKAEDDVWVEDTDEDDASSSDECQDHL